MKQENLASGYIKLYRAITQHPIFSAPQATYFKIWTFLILNAAWRAHPVYLGGPIVPRGGLFIGARKLSEECNVPYHVTRLCLDRLVKEGMIEILAQKAAHLGSLITITNYETYQSDNEQDGALSGAAAAQRRRSGGAAAAQSEEGKEGKEGKKEHLPDGQEFSLASSAPEEPHGKRAANHTNLSESADFLEFYATYPRHKGREAAWRAYRAAIKTPQQHTEMMAGLREALPDFLPRDPKFIPYPSTWLNQKRWFDSQPVNCALAPSAVPQGHSPDEPGYDEDLDWRVMGSKANLEAMRRRD